MEVTLDDTPVTLVGHPYAAIGMGEQMRSHLRALRAIHVDAGVLDIFRYASRADPAHQALIDAHERRDIPGGIRIFHVNGDEVERVLEAFAAKGGRFEDGRNVIVPAWELPRYPAVWAEQLARFDEVWAISDFVRDSLAAAGVASHVVGQSVEAQQAAWLPRRWFGIRESAFVLLYFFDLSSYAARKNPQGARGLLERLVQARPFDDVQLVLKVKDGADAAGADWLQEWAREFGRDTRVRVLNEPLDSVGVGSLIRACDCFVSLHRAEGFGRGLGEAMAQGRLALGTGWSGNLDFMTPENSLLVDHRMVRVKRDAYPHATGQSWADPDLDHAAALLRPMLDEPARARALAERGRRDVLRSHGHRAVGLRMLARLEALLASPQPQPVHLANQVPAKRMRRA